MENNILNMEHLSDSDKAKITYEKYRQDAENLYLTAVKRWKKHLFIYVVLFIVCLIATYLFALNIFGFMNFFYIFMGGLATFFSGIAGAQTYRNLRMEKQHYQFRLRSAIERIDQMGLYFELPEEDYNKFNRWWN